jgi:hypothetical protein
MNIKSTRDWPGTATELITAIDARLAEITSRGETPLAETHETIEDDEEE